jgi:type II secretory pathway predicted ATPase ExeA
MFTGRIDELEALEKALYQTQKGNPQHVLTTGERGIGKSSLLLYLDAVARGKLPTLGGEKHKFVVLRHEPDPADALGDLLRRLAAGLLKLDQQVHDMKAKAKKILAFVQRIEAGGFKLASSATVSAQIELDDFADSISDFIEGLGEDYDGLLLVVDEADRAINCDFGRFCKLLTERVQRSNSNRLGIVLAGLPGTADVLVRSHESSLRIFERIELGPLTKEDRIEVVHGGLREAAKKGDPVTISEDAVSALSDMSDGFPQFIQQFAYSAFEAATGNEIDLAAFHRGLPNAITQLAAKYFQGPVLREIFSDDYRSVLAAMSQDSDGWVKKAQIRERTQLKDSQIANALNTLKSKQLIVPKDGQKGVYRLQSKAFALWIEVYLKSQRQSAETLSLDPNAP